MMLMGSGHGRRRGPLRPRVPRPMGPWPVPGSQSCQGCSASEFTSRLKMSLPERQSSPDFYDSQGPWKCQGPPKTIILAFLEPQNYFKSIQKI